MLAEVTPTAAGAIGAAAVTACGLIVIAAVKLLGRKKVTCPISSHVKKLEDYERRLTGLAKDIQYLLLDFGKVESKLKALDDAIQGMRLEMAGYFTKRKGS